jgi:hydrogenase-4 component B
MPNLLLLAIGLLGLSGLLGLATPRGRRLGDECCAALTVLGGLLGAGCALTILVRGLDVSLSVGWPLPLGRMAFRIDPLAAVFLLPVFVVPALGSVYAAGYWAEADHPRSARRLRVFHGLLAAAMALVVVAQDGVFLLFAWELMALSAFFAVSAEDERPEVRRAAWIYFIATHVGTLALLGLLALLRSASGSFALTPLPATLAAPVATGVFVLALIGFGVKAGLMPLHVWLPGAHANAPSHVSAVLSGVMLKVGLYGLLRTLSLLPTIPAWWGWTLVGVGGGSAFLGIAFSLAQRDYKRQLAYSSIENVGIITLGLGLALLGRATHSPALTAFGLAGALLHVWNHSVFKPLLFFVAGALLQATHTRELDDLGGLAGRMPRTAVVAAIGCLAIAATCKACRRGSAPSPPAWPSPRPCSRRRAPWPSRASPSSTRWPSSVRRGRPPSIGPTIRRRRCSCRWRCSPACVWASASSPRSASVCSCRPARRRTSSRLRSWPPSTSPGRSPPSP